MKSFIVSGKNRRAVLRSLLKSPMMPIEVSIKVNLKPQHVARTCKDLLKMGAIKDLTPNCKRNKVYDITKVGRKIALELEKEKLL